MADAWLDFVTILGLVVISVVTRSFFFVSDRAWPFPEWLKVGLKYAPVAALCAVAVPAVLIGGQATVPPADWAPRAMAALVALGLAWWRKDMLLTIIAGMGAFHLASWLFKI